jgi:hypothetical protein
MTTLFYTVNKPSCGTVALYGPQKKNKIKRTIKGYGSAAKTNQPSIWIKTIKIILQCI